MKGGFILALASLAGFLSSIIFSVTLEREAYGEITTIFSIISILTLAAPLGTNAYFLTNIALYKENSNAITSLPLVIAVFMGAAVFIIYSAPLNIAILLMLITGTLSLQGILAAQTSQNSTKAALYQSNQAILKFISAISVAIYFSIKKQHSNSLEIIAYSLIIGCTLSLPFLLNGTIDRTKLDNIFRYNFFAKLNRNQWITILSFWLSSMLGVSYSLGIIPLISYFHSYSLSAYLGIYFIFWSGENILITTLINNYYWPKACSERQLGSINHKTILDAGKASVFISLLTTTGTTTASLLLAEILWPEYTDIKIFLYTISAALFLRPLSAWIGMMMLSLDSKIIRKTTTQLIVTLLMLLYVFLVEIQQPFDLALMLVVLESSYLLGYIIASTPKSSNLLIRKK
ncbi:hypothetical protein D9M68_311970 [compost metagenome]